MNGKGFSFSTIISMLLASFLAISCSEKDDFIPEPTATSVIVTGTVTTTSGKPLADIPVSIDYYESYYLGAQNILHKAKGTTDSDGHYRLFFEPEATKVNGNPSQVYYLHADLKDLPSSEFIMPGDFDDKPNTTYAYGIYETLRQGENVCIDLHFPKKKEIMTELKNFTADRSLEVRNSIQFGAEMKSVRHIVDLDDKGNGSVRMTCALGELNKFSVGILNSFSEACEPKEFTIGNDSDSPLVFDNEDVLKNCRFKLSLYTYTGFNGEEPDSKNALYTPAPFDFLGFRIVRPDGEYDAFGLERYQYYDSIVWDSPEFPESYKIYHKEENGSASEKHLISQWGSYFFDNGPHKTVLKGYRNGRVICADSVTFELKDRDFLCFDWDKCKALPKVEKSYEVFCQLDGFLKYIVTDPVETDGIKSLDISIRFRDSWDKATLLNWQQVRLENLLSKHLGHWIEYDGSSVGKLFHNLSPADKPGKFYENESTRAIVMHRLPSDYEEEHFYVHVESKPEI